MYSHEAANKFCDFAGINKQSIRNQQAANMIECEAECQIRDGRFKGQKNQYDKALEQALENMKEWYRSAEEYHFDSVSDFVATHRRACAWTVLMALNM